VYNNGALIQNAFPFLNATEREFLMTGMPFIQQEAFFKEAYQETNESVYTLSDD
jgi:hypothetical protein